MKILSGINKVFRAKKSKNLGLKTIFRSKNQFLGLRKHFVGLRSQKNNREGGFLLGKRRQKI